MAMIGPGRASDACGRPAQRPITSAFGLIFAPAGPGTVMDVATGREQLMIECSYARSGEGEDEKGPEAVDARASATARGGATRGRSRTGRARKALAVLEAETAGRGISQVVALRHEDLLGEGEVVILAVKPSAWFVLLVSWQVLLGLVAIAACAYLAEQWVGSVGLTQAALLACLACGCARIIVACFQWMGRLYMLTNLRVLRIRGLSALDVVQCPLKHVRKTSLSASPFERLLGLGALVFHRKDEQTEALRWVAVANAADVRNVVEEAIARGR